MSTILIIILIILLLGGGGGYYGYNRYGHRGLGGVLGLVLIIILILWLLGGLHCTSCWAEAGRWVMNAYCRNRGVPRDHASWSRFAQARAASRRSLPQNSSPSLETKLGAPKMPSRCARSVWVRSCDLIVSDCALASTAAGS